MKIIRPLIYVLLVLIGAFLIFLIYSTLADFQPEEITLQAIEHEPDVLVDSMDLSLMIWNIGYAGLDASMDFFYDGGKKMRPEEEALKSNIKGIQRTLDAYRDLDFLMLQEVDKNSKRSYHINEYQIIKEQFQGYHTSFGVNYKVDFVPIPVTGPMGKVESGLMTLSKHSPGSVERHSFPGNYSWPVKLFMLDRCFLVNRYQLSKQKELILINTHNSAYDDGSLREQQMAYLRNFLVSEYEKGNYVIVGGDWNQTPYGLKPELPSHVFDTVDLTFMEKDFPSPDWNWSFDSTLPTNRRLATPFEQSSSPSTIIDCFLASPNVELSAAKTIDLGFKYSDHHPVILQARLSLNQ